MTLSEGALGAGSFEVQSLGGDVVHGRLKVGDAGAESIGGEARPSNSRPALQLLSAGGEPGTHGEHVGRVGWRCWSGGQTVDVNTTDSKCRARCAKPLANVHPRRNNSVGGVAHSRLHESLVERCLGHGPEWGISQDAGSGRHQQDATSINFVHVGSGVAVGSLVQHWQGSNIDVACRVAVSSACCRRFVPCITSTIAARSKSTIRPWRSGHRNLIKPCPRRLR